LIRWQIREANTEASYFSNVPWLQLPLAKIDNWRTKTDSWKWVVKMYCVL